MEDHPVFLSSLYYHLSGIIIFISSSLLNLSPCRFQLQEDRVFSSFVHGFLLLPWPQPPLHCASSSGSALTSQPTFPLPETPFLGFTADFDQLQLWIILNGHSVGEVPSLIPSPVLDT